MSETTVDDPILGTLVWEAFEGWAGSFAHAEFLSWGAAVRAALPQEDEDDGEDDAADPLAAETLREAGRLKVVVRISRDDAPTAAQQAAWRAFREDAALPEKIAAAVLDAYQRQRPERVRWWNILYGDSPDPALPEIRTTAAIRAIIDPDEFRVYPELRGGVTIGVLFSSFWCDETFKVHVRDGAVTGIGPVERQGWSAESDAEEFHSPVFGRLQRGIPGGWKGVFHSDALRGDDNAPKWRKLFKEKPWAFPSPYRALPPWDVITGDYVLQVDTADDQYPTPEQEAAFLAFNADPAATARQVLAAILTWY